MKKILPLFILLSCSSPSVEDNIQLNKECINCISDTIDTNIISHTDSLLMENDSLLKKIQKQLEKTVVTEKNVKTTLTKEKKLRKENRKLKKEIKKTNQVVDSIKKEIEIMKKMMPGKRNFIQKVLKIEVDSVEVVDTVMKEN